MHVQLQNTEYSAPPIIYGEVPRAPEEVDSGAMLLN